MLFLPETCRKIVDNGAIPPPWTSWNLSDRRRFKNRASKGTSVDEQKLADMRSNHSISIPNPMSTLVVLADFETALILFATGLALALFYAICSGASKNFYTIYGFDDLQVSLIFVRLKILRPARSSPLTHVAPRRCRRHHISIHNGKLSRLELQTPRQSPRLSPDQEQTCRPLQFSC